MRVGLPGWLVYGRVCACRRVRFLRPAPRNARLPRSFPRARRASRRCLFRLRRFHPRRSALLIFAPAASSRCFALIVRARVALPCMRRRAPRVSLSRAAGSALVALRVRRACRRVRLVAVLLLPFAASALQLLCCWLRAALRPAPASLARFRRPRPRLARGRVAACVRFVCRRCYLPLPVAAPQLAVAVHLSLESTASRSRVWRRPMPRCGPRVRVDRCAGSYRCPADPAGATVAARSATTPVGMSVP